MLIWSFMFLAFKDMFDLISFIAMSFSLIYPNNSCSVLHPAPISHFIFQIYSCPYWCHTPLFIHWLNGRASSNSLQFKIVSPASASTIKTQILNQKRIVFPQLWAENLIPIMISTLLETYLTKNKLYAFTHPQSKLVTTIINIII